MIDIRGRRLIFQTMTALTVAIGLSACGTVADPTSWFADDHPASSQTQPDLASVPGRPTPPSSAEENAQVADSLAADQAQADYSSENLRGGTETAAPPPPVNPPPAEVPPPAEASASPPSQPAADEETAAQQSAPQAETATAAASPAEPTQAGTLPPPVEQPAERTASAAPEPAPAAAVSAPQAGSTGPVAGAQAPMTTGGGLGFAKSTAPPLDPGVSQFVPSSVVARYRETARLEPPKYPAWSGSSGTPAAVVEFPNDALSLNAEGREEVRRAAAAFQRAGGQGYVRIVGHASETTGNLSQERLLSVNFDRSQARARAVAQALIAAGVPADKVLIDTAGGAAPRAMAEIYLQS